MRKRKFRSTAAVSAPDLMSELRKERQRSPCLRQFSITRRLPSSVRGLVHFCALRRLAATSDSRSIASALARFASDNSFERICLDLNRLPIEFECCARATHPFPVPHSLLSRLLEVGRGSS